MEPIFQKRKPGCLGIDPDDMYGSMGDYFCLKFHYGGHFVGEVTRDYVAGSVDVIDMVEAGKLSMETIIQMIDFLGDGRFMKNEVFFPYFRVPGENLTSGLHYLRTERDVKKLVSYTSQCRCIRVYVEHGQTTIKSNVRSSDVTSHTNPESEPVIVIDNDGVSHFITPSPEYIRSRGNNVSQRVVNHERKLKNNSLDAWLSQTVKDTSDGGVIALGSGSSGSSGSCSRDKRVRPQVEVVPGNVAYTESGDTHGVESLVDVHVRSLSSDGSDFDMQVVDSPVLEDNDSDKYYFETAVDDSVEWYDKAHKGKEKIDVGDKVCDIEDLDFDELTSTNGDVENKEKDKGQTSNPRNPLFNKKRDMAKPKFFLKQEFASKKELRDAIMQHCIDTRREIKFVKNDKQRLRAICRGVVPGPAADDFSDKDKVDCPWTLHASVLPDDSTWQIKTFVDDHWCLQTRVVKACTYKYLAEGLTEVVKRNPGIPVSALKQDLEEKFQVHVSRMKAFRAKSKAHNLVVGTFKEQYAHLRNYCMEIIRTNLGTTMKIDTEPEPNPHIDTRVFHRIYCCLGPLKRGFQAGCRPVLGLDGTFIKGPYPGQLLSAVGLDANNGLYPLAWALVEAENMRSWEWFLDCLGDDLDITTESKWCFMSDRQKGLIPAIAKLFPDAEHRFCLKHIWDNFKLNFKGLSYKDLLWSAATATNIPYFEKAMEEVKKLDPKAHEWLSQIPPCHWSKSHFGLFPRSDILYNNLCETFNSKILDARDKPIITCLENIRLYVSNRIVAVRKEIERTKSILCPKIQGNLEEVKKKASNLRAVWHGRSKYQVSGPYGDQVVVDLQAKSCTCRRWDLTSIPCKHAVRAIWCNIENGGGGDSLPENWVDECYKVETWRRIYGHEINPIAGVTHWIHTAWPSKLLPPIHHVQPGRPKKARRKSQDEIASLSQRSRENTQGDDSQPTSLKKSRKGGTVHCNKCGNSGHNSRTCKGQGSSTNRQIRRGREHVPSASVNGSGYALRSNSRPPPGGNSFQNGSTYRVDTTAPRRGPIIGARGAMFWLGESRK